MQASNHIHFTKAGKTRFVKHGLSWQIGLFGPIAFFMRDQLKVALRPIAAGMAYLAAMLLALTVIESVIDRELLVELIRLVLIGGYVALFGYFGNYFSARDYVKRGWMPVAEFPQEWNRPPATGTPGLEPLILITGVHH